MAEAMAKVKSFEQQSNSDSGNQEASEDDLVQALARMKRGGYNDRLHTVDILSVETDIVSLRQHVRFYDRI